MGTPKFIPCHAPQNQATRSQGPHPTTRAGNHWSFGLNLRSRALAALLVAGGIAHADTLTQYLAATRVSGDIRSYYVNQIHTSSQAPNRYAYSLGGMLQIQTAPLYGVNAQINFYTANGLGANDMTSPYTHLDPLLMGAHESLNVLGQAYLQYANHWLTIRAGDQLLNTPWINPSDAFMIPSSFQAVSAYIRPFTGVRVTAIRASRFKNRTEDSFTDNTLLNQNGLYQSGSDDDGGASVLGTQYHHRNLRTAVWLYHFDNTANLFYSTVHYALPTQTGINPFAGVQYAREQGTGTEYAGPVDAFVYGAIIGANIQRTQLFAAYNDIPARPPLSINGNVLYNGGFVSPYTQQYSADPLYTSIMDYGLVSSAAANHAWKFGVIIHPGHGWRLKYSYSLYKTAPAVPVAYANYISVGYALNGLLKGLSVHNRLAIVRNDPFNDYHGTFIDDRLMFQYAI